MDSTTACDQFHLEEMDVLSLYRVLEQVSDHRQKQGVRYPLALVLSLVIVGKLAGMTSLAGIAEWVRWRADQFKLLLPGRDRGGGVAVLGQLCQRRKER